MKDAGKEAWRVARKVRQADEESRNIRHEAAAELARGIQARMAAFKRQAEEWCGLVWTARITYHRDIACQRSNHKDLATFDLTLNDPPASEPRVYNQICCGPQRIGDGSEYSSRPDDLVPFAKSLASLRMEDLETAFLAEVKRHEDKAEASLREAEGRAELARNACKGVLDANQFAARARGVAA